MLKRIIVPTGTVTIGVLSAAWSRPSGTVSVPLKTRITSAPRRWRIGTVPLTARSTVTTSPSRAVTRMCSTPSLRVMNGCTSDGSRSRISVSAGSSERPSASAVPSGTA